MFLHNNFTGLKEFEPFDWQVGNIEQAKKLKQKMHIEDIKESLLPPGHFQDALAWTSEWDKPFRNIEKTAVNDDTLEYREGLMPVKPNVKYQDFDVGYPLQEFEDEEVSVSHYFVTHSS
jgi:hypothetical protein